MNTAVPGTIHEGRVELEAPVDWPEGTKVKVSLVDPEGQKIGMSEEEWSDSPEALADWEAWFRSRQPLKMTAEEEAEFQKFQEEVGRYSKEAMRRQMEEGLP
jgi:hypothetical protein